MSGFNYNRDEWEISLLFRRSYGLSSAAIAWWGNSVRGYSHVDAELWGGLVGARDDVIRPPNYAGKIPAGLRWRPKNYEPFKYADRVTIPVREWQFTNWQDALDDILDAKYDEDAILGFLFGQKWHAQGRWICSAAQTHCLEAPGIIAKLPVEPQQVTPDNLFFIVASIRGARVESVPGQPK